MTLLEAPPARTIPYSDLQEGEIAELRTESLTTPQGRLVIVTSAMGVGKSEFGVKLINTCLESGVNQVGFKAIEDKRYPPYEDIASRNGTHAPAVPLSSADAILDEYHRRRYVSGEIIVTVIDEPFIIGSKKEDTPEDIQARALKLAADCEHMRREHNTNVVVLTLDTNFLRDEFAIYTALSQNPAAERFKILGDCDNCGQPSAQWTQRLYGQQPASRHTPLIVVAGSQLNPELFSYQKRCTNCHIIPD